MVIAPAGHSFRKYRYSLQHQPSGSIARYLVTLEFSAPMPHWEREDMATSARIIANQKNAQLSTGPRTADGKSASSRNAIKHGLSSAFRVLAHEDQEEFDRLIEDLRAYHRPRDIHQRLLVDQIAKSQWLLARAQRLQAVAYDLLAGVEDASDPDAAIVKAMRAANPDVIGRLERYAASAERSFYKAYRELNKQKEANAVCAIEAELADYRAAAQPRLIQTEPNIPAAANPRPTEPLLRDSRASD